ncbi:bifunctional glutamate N-acetyltransferase/amino-acid acetyltransferase ArgJ [Gimesia maris]|uniref:Arginine biosynthesis bifunctional protein ArgJ n=1 Tax=Gimesia maris TaxID=122 RepID=A0ABX5YIM7_9PLAN|nr:bifunctional glutamate N-acetyltransferase/amino-acid acetyltransferase ArgJ [Gimesia maris]QDU13537.1 Arginine biosynthesis bifunctional protein ArgJ [Gimesia maris]QEG15465.1 Arginine biosynthesis bifunctional protein ArgJ [Gimesia maris]
MTADMILPRGFRSAGLACGIKEKKTTFDLSLFVSDVPCAGAGVFTKNQVCGAPVKVSRERVPGDSLRAVVINSGNANACTGERGIEDAKWMTGLVAGGLGVAAEDVLVCSTGIIGRFLPRTPLEAGIPAAIEQLGADAESFLNAARGMMTTDTVPKQSTRVVSVGGQEVRVSGVAKGAAMIAPNMATMLSVIMTDAPLDATQTDQMLRHAVDRSFNCVSVEGHTSTSDTVILLANGASEAHELSETELTQLQTALDEVAMELGQAIIRDAEGADHFVTIEVSGAADRADAMEIARTIANDALVKTAIAGSDPNWGRIVSASGRTSVKLTERDIVLHINGALIYEDGRPADYNEQAISDGIRQNRDVLIQVRLPFGEEQVVFWTSDLTQEYVRLNSEYTT